jgi:hypothetical protein
VAAEAIIRNASVAESRRCPTRRLMAILTDIARSDVIGGFTSRFGAIVATKAIVRNAAVRERGWSPACDFVAVFANIAGG